MGKLRHELLINGIGDILTGIHIPVMSVANNGSSLYIGFLGSKNIGSILCQCIVSAIQGSIKSPNIGITV